MKLRTVTAALLASFLALSSLTVTGCSETVAGSCDGQCCFGMHMGDPGTCIECRKPTPFDSHALCTACAERGGRCMHCMKTIRR